MPNTCKPFWKAKLIWFFNIPISVNTIGIYIYIYTLTPVVLDYPESMVLESSADPAAKAWFGRRFKNH